VKSDLGDIEDGSSYDATDPTLDPLAVVSLVASICVPAVFTVVVEYNIGGYAGAIRMLRWALMAGAIATASGGLISIVRIKRSSGSLHGVELAIAALVVSIVVATFAAFVIFVGVVLGFDDFH
jgi:hypothetical protein